MEDTSLNFKQALVGQLTDMLMVARLDESGNAIGGGYYSVADLVALINTIQVEDNLTTTNLTSALSANQGRILKELIDGKANADAIATVADRQNVLLDNKFVNGNLTNGTTGWITHFGTNSVTDNILSNTGNGSADYPYASQSLDFELSTGDKIFVYGKARVTNSDCSLLRNDLYPSGGGGSGYNFVKNPTPNVWYEFSHIFEIGTTTGGNSSVGIYHIYADATTANGKVMQIDGNTGVYGLNLTKIWGKGDEPSEKSIKKLLEVVGFVDSTYILANLDLVNWLLSVIDEPIYYENKLDPPYWIFHLDCGRKYFTPENIKSLIDKISMAGFNQMQLHFSEDIGFRFALDDMNFVDEDGISYDLTACLGGTESPTEWLTQTEMDSIIDYAQLKGIDIIPSLDMPGHMGRILSVFPQFKYNGSGTLDITSTTAIKFAKAIANKYSKYFISRGCHFYNFGYDEIVNSTGFETFYNDGDYQTVVDFANILIDLIKENGLIPRVFNEVVYYQNDYNYFIKKDVEIMSWYNNIPEGFATPDTLQEIGYHMINANYNYYWVLGKPTIQVTSEFLDSTDLLTNYYNFTDILGQKAYGAMLSVWCDLASTVDVGDGGDSVVIAMTPLIVSFGEAIERALN